MNQKELTKPFMIITNLKKPPTFHGLNRNNSALLGLTNRLSGNHDFIVFKLFYKQVKPLSLGMKCVFEQDLQRFGIRLNKYE